MKSIIKNNKYKQMIRAGLIFLLVFVIAFVTIHFLGFLNGYGDPMNSYGFAKAIKMGQVPYKEFNTISTPLYAFYQAIFLFIFDDFVMINVSQALLITISCFLLYKLYGKKSFILLGVVAFFQYKNLVATYNFLSLFMIIVLVYMEQKHFDKDFLIGILLALSVLSKQTVGCFMLIPSIIFYRKKIKKILKRFYGFLIPCFIFLIYLLVNKALYSFFDLCLFGLFDFMNNNGVGGGHINYTWMIPSIATFIIALYILVKNKKDINNYYLIIGVLFAFPLFDITHFSFWATCFLLMLLPYIKKYENYIVSFVTVTSVSVMMFIFFFWTLQIDLCFTKKLNHYRYNIHMRKVYNSLNDVNDFFNTYDEPIIISYQSMFYTISNNKKLSYFDVLYDGNYGYNGTKKMKKRIDDMHDQIFIVSVSDYESDDEFSQFSKEIVKYVMDNSKKIDSKYVYDVYYKE